MCAWPDPLQHRADECHSLFLNSRKKQETVKWAAGERNEKRGEARRAEGVMEERKEDGGRAGKGPHPQCQGMRASLTQSPLPTLP